MIAAACLMPAPSRAYSTNVHTSFHWHMHQPIYWPNRRDYGVDHYEQAWDTIQAQNAGRPDPSPEVLSTVFGESDRVNDYQGYYPYDAISSILSYPNAGASMSFSGALMENVQSLAAAGQLGYATGWNQDDQTLRSWTTSGGHPRLDLVNFDDHHALAPLVSPTTLQMELLVQQRQMQIFWGTSQPLSRGYFPPETCFAEYMIPTLQSNGVAWAIVANNHLARACADFPVVTGSGGENCDLPNLADQIDPSQGAGNYQRISIQRGCAPTQVMPFGFQVHYARYVDPQTGAASTIMVVPSDQAFGWMDSYGTWNLDLLAPLQARNNPAKPALALFAHDGDNAWSGGNSYYTQWVNEAAGQAGSLGYEPTTVEQFLQDFPPATNDIVHVESGGWVFADSDFGSPIYINWHWPPSYSAANGANVVDPSQGTSTKADNWRVIVATENRVRTAQQISGITPNIDQVRDPGSFSGTPNGVELGWHYYLASLDSGFVYYGCTGDECERAIVAQSNAARNVDPIIATNASADSTPPTVFIPQRHPWNPGGTNFGVQYGYTLTLETNTDFWIWTYAYDVSGITNATLFFRNDGTNPPVSDEFKTYTGGPDTGPWITSNLTLRVVPPELGITPQYIADYYYTKVTGITNAYVDYYVSATDSRGNTCKTPIQHVWVGAGSGAGGGGGNGNGCEGAVCVTPVTPVAGSQVTIQYDPAGGPIASATTVDIHLGWNGWDPVVSPDAAMTFLSASNLWQYAVTVPNTATQLNCCFNNGSGTWDNHSGANWNFSVTANTNPVVPSQPQNLAATPVQTNQIDLTWSAASGATGYIVNRADAPIALTSATSYADTGLTSNTSYCYSIVASNSAGFSTPSAAVCTNTPAVSSITSECEGVVCLMPAPPLAGSQVTIQYDPAGGPIASATTVDIHLGWNGWNPVVSPDAAMTLLTVSNLWQYTVTIPNTATQLNCCFNNGSGTWANNNGTNWNFNVTANAVAPSQPQNLAATPAQTNEIDLAWSAASGATGYLVNRGGSTVALISGTNYSDTGLAADTSYCYSITASNSVGLSAPSATVCANTLAVTIPAFVLNGAFNYPGYLLASNSTMVLYAAMRGTVLYVATGSPGTNGPNDCFLFVTDQLSASATNPAPWAKAGEVAVSPNKPYLAAESQDTYISWYNNNIQTNYPCSKSYNTSGAMAGTIDLLAAFGYMPTNIYLCAAAYVTTNGGPLVGQCPAGSGPNINPGGFLEIPTAALQDSEGNGVFNLLDPARGFVVLGAGMTNGAGFTLNWASMPGRGYQVLYSDALGGSWSALPGATNVAGPLLLILSYTDAVPTNVPERFYRVELAP